MRDTIESHQQLNRAIVSLNQAMLGAISDNFRMITISMIDNHWKLSFYLMQDIPEDREEIDWIVEEFNSFQSDDHMEVLLSVIITAEDLKVQPPSTRTITVFRKRD